MGSAPQRADVKLSFSKINRKNMVVHVHGRVNAFQHPLLAKNVVAWHCLHLGGMHWPSQKCG